MEKYKKLDFRMTPAPNAQIQNAHEELEKASKDVDERFNAYEETCKKVAETDWNFLHLGGLKDRQKGLELHNSVEKTREESLKDEEKALQVYLDACKVKAEKIKLLHGTICFCQEAKKAGWFKGKSWSPSTKV